MKSLCFSCFIKSTKALRILASVSVFGILLLSSFVINPVYISIDKAEGTTGTATESTTSLTLASTATDTSIVLTPGAGFTLSTSTNTSSYDVITNNYTGYTITLTSEDNDKTLVHTVDNTKVISSINTPTAETDFVSTTSGLMNHFGIKPNKYYDTENNTTIDNTVSSTILPAPGTTGLILDKTTSANSTANNYSIALGAMVDGTIPAGDYTRDLNLVAIANPVAYRVIFNKNTNDTVSNMPTEYSGSTSTTGINIPNTIPERTGYTFAGWCNRKDTLNTCPTGGTTYSPGSAYGIDQTSQNEVTLYAIWQPNYYMQDVAIWGKTLTIGQSMQAIDRRDNKIYWVTKEETDPSNPRAEIDETTGKAFQIWMTQNLDLDLDSTKTYTHADTDLGYTTNNTLATWQPIRSTMTDVSNWVDDETSPYSISIGSYFAYTSGSNVADDSTNKDTSYNSLAACTNAGHLAEDCAHYSTGNYYNWPAAISSNDVQNNIAAYTTMPDSICPAGWRLPVGATGAGSRSDYGYLLYQNGVILENYGANVNQANTFADNGLNKFREAPIWIVRAGNIGSQTHLGWLFVTHVWSSSAYSDYLGIDLAASSTSLSSVGGFLRHFGFSVRCVARPEKTMQTVATWQDELAIGDSVQAVDLRDNKIYWVTKEETDAANPRAEMDKITGKSYQIWMTQNLDYDLKTTETLISSTSDVTTSWTPVRATTTDANDWVHDLDTPYSYDPGEKIYYTSGSSDADTSTNVDAEYSSMEDCISANHSAGSCAHYKAGNYYNWSSAIANNDISGLTTSHRDMPDSICPAGWRLPTGINNTGKYSDYSYLLNKNGVTPSGSYGGTGEDVGFASNGLVKLTADPLWITRAGNTQTKTIILGGVGIYYWASTTLDRTNSYSMGGTSAYMSPSNTFGRMYGFSVRCLARNTMQDATENSIAALTNSTADNNTKLTDKRDGKVYTVGKLPDGSIWMTKNLNLAAGTTLTPDKSNVATEYTLPESSRHGFYDNDLAFVYNDASDTCADNQPCYSYYSYAAATAGTNPSTGESTYDICPKGWRLPTKNEAASLTSIYTSGNTMTAAPWYGIYTGYLGDEYMADGGVRGYYWSSAVAEANVLHAYWYGFGTSSADVGRGYKASGIPVRCVLKGMTIDDISTLQDFSSLSIKQKKDAVKTMQTGVTYQFEDTRDGEVYNVAKLADGNVWFQDNLRLGGSSPINLTPADTNITSNYTLPASINANFTILSESQINADSKNNLVSYGDGEGKVGVYYNFCAASGGTICTDPIKTDSSYDICPAGWRLPSGWDTGEYWKLYQLYSGDDEFRSALHATFSGRYSNYLSGVFEQGGADGKGRYWSSTLSADYSYAMDVLSVTASSISYTEDAIYMGVSIRCILDITSIGDIATMQDFDSLTPIQRKNVLQSMVADVSYTVTDSRDNQNYTITKLPDNTIWMTKNLNLAGGTALTPDTSNIANNYTLPASDLGGFDDPTVASVYNSGNTTCDGTNPCYSYYNYMAATAGTSPDAGDARYDICPKGWRLPTRGELEKLLTIYTTPTSISSAPWYSVYAGSRYRSQWYHIGQYGFYWTSTPDGATGAYNMDISHQYGDAVNSDGKESGITIRCLLNTSLQDVTTDTLSMLIPNVGDTIALSDKRDNEKYTIGRLADGRVWILENLRLGGASSISLTSNNTNLAVNGYTLPASANSGDTYTEAKMNSDSKNVIQVVGSENIKVGNYYNYCAATAGSYCYASGAGTGHAVQDLCPKGWRMPTGGETGEYQGLYSAYGSNNDSYRNALRITFSGFYADSRIIARDTEGYFMASTGYDGSSMYDLHINSTGLVKPVHSNARYFGFSIRCIKSS